MVILLLAFLESYELNVGKMEIMQKDHKLNAWSRLEIEIIVEMREEKLKLADMLWDMEYFLEYLLSILYILSYFLFIYI
jgi:hypothetical protein